MTDEQTPKDPPPGYDDVAAERTNGAKSAAPQGVRRAPAPIDIPIIKHLNAKRVILASASPRRRTLLQQVGLRNLEITPSTIPEDLDKSAHGPWEYVSETGRRKGLSVYQKSLETQLASIPDPDLVISADTVVVTREGRVLEKPRSEADHIAMLKHLRDSHMHRVLTSVTAIAPREDARHPGYDMSTKTVETKVYFYREDNGLPDDVIEAYVKTREGVDKAGGYGIQGVAGLLLIEKIEGSIDNVIGLPVHTTLELAEKVIFRQDEVDFEGEEIEDDE